MTILEDEDAFLAAQIRHYPSNPDKFEFDEEVARIFDSMVIRSIPGYQESHAFAVDIALEKLVNLQEQALVLDVGTSRGHFIRSIWEMFDIPVTQSIPNVGCIGVDSSAAMLEYARKSCPKALFIEMDVSDTRNISSIDGEFDVVNLAYILQFIPRRHRFSLLHALCSKMKPGAYLFVSQKFDPDTYFSGTLDRLYRDFRKYNGYSDEEIDAKNRALKNTMWLDTQEDTMEMLEDAGFIDITVIHSIMQFNTMVARKR